MKLICQDFHFYPNGNYTSISKLDSPTNSFFADIEEISDAIRIFGTKNQIDQALNEYCKITGLALDECYSYKVEPKNGYWWDIYKEPEKRNKEVKERLAEYKKKYTENNNQTLILNLI